MQPLDRTSRAAAGKVKCVKGGHNVSPTLSVIFDASCSCAS